MCGRWRHRSAPLSVCGTRRRASPIRSRRRAELLAGLILVAFASVTDVP